MVKERGMKHPSQRAQSSGPPGGPPVATADDDLPAAEAAGDAALDEHRYDLLARDLDALRAEIEALAGAAPVADEDERADAVRERYSELLEDYGDDPEALTRVRAVGRRIKDLEEADILPRSLIRRGRSRR
jgi:hypothetical protein